MLTVTLAVEQLRPATLSRLIALAGSGMCEGGRVVDFIADQIGNPAATVALCGYALPDTRAHRLRQLAAGQWPDATLTLGAARIGPSRVRARVVHFGDYYSGHGDRDALTRFVFETGAARHDPRPTTVFVNHGDDDMRAGLAAALRARAAAAQPGDRTIERVELPAAGRRHELDAADLACIERRQARVRR